MRASENELYPGVGRLRSLIREVPDFPLKGVIFKDIAPLLADAAGLALAVEFMAQPFRGKGIKLVVGAESRGFVLGAAVAQALSVGFVPVRKAGKLPGPVRRRQFKLEYGTDAFEMQEGAIGRGQDVLVVDDVLATGGTLVACCELVRDLGGRVAAISILIELLKLGGRHKLSDYQVVSVIQYD